MRLLLLIIFLAISSLFMNFESNKYNYIVVKNFDNIEIRDYSEQIYASYTPQSTNDRNNSFKNVAGFIFGDNSRQEEIAMTSPVVIKLHNKNEMAFIMPSEYSLKNLPAPNNDKIKIYKEPSSIRAAVRYSGYSNSEVEEEKKQELIKVLRENDINHKGDFEVLVYNSPWKFINRRNEIIVTIDYNKEKSMKSKNNINKIYFGGGCFWCVEAVFEDVIGVENVKSGYSGGDLKNPSYNQVANGLTKHAEVCEIAYNADIISLRNLLKIFFLSHDPTTLNRQGNDIGAHYRSIILYNSEKEYNVINKYIDSINKELFNNKIVTEIKPLNNFYEAENYHQNYYKNNSFAGYCRAVITPKVLKAKKELNKFYK